MDTDVQERPAVNATTYRSSEPAPARRLGQLVGEVCLAVHSQQALRLVWGRRRTAEKPAITGLIAFASAVNTLWQAAESGDLYALWWLIKVETGIEEGRSFLIDQTADAGCLYPDAEVLEVATAESEQPYRVRLAFSNPYAYRAAHLLGEYDALVRTCHTLSFVGAGNPAQLQAMIARAGHQVRRVFAIPQGFKACGVTRDDLCQNSQSNQRAIQLMGPLPGDMVSGEVLPLFLPPGARSESIPSAPPLFENTGHTGTEGVVEARGESDDEIPA